MMSYKASIINSYGDEIYKCTKKLQELKAKPAIAKNQWTFLNRCLFHHVIPKSFRTRSTLNTRKGWNITHMYDRQIMTATRNSVKEKYLKQLHMISTLSGELRTSMREPDYTNLENITNKAKEKTFIKERERLKKKFEVLSTNRKSFIDVNDGRQQIGRQQIGRQQIGRIKTTVLNLTNATLQPHITELLNLGPKFVPTPRSIPFMNIITSTESAAIDLDKVAKHHESENLRQQVSNTLSKFVNKKIPSNLNHSQCKALKELRMNNETKVYPFDKGSGFVLLSQEDALAKMSEQLGEAKKINTDPTRTLLGKFQRTLSKLRKEGKFNTNEYREIYPSDAIPPRMYGMLKAHKPNKNYPMRTVVSTVGTVSHGTSRMLVKLIQATLNKNTARLAN